MTEYNHLKGLSPEDAKAFVTQYLSNLKQIDNDMTWYHVAEEEDSEWKCTEPAHASTEWYHQSVSTLCWQRLASEGLHVSFCTLNVPKLVDDGCWWLLMAVDGCWWLLKLLGAVENMWKDLSSAFCIEKSMPLELYQDSDWNSDWFFSCFMEATVQARQRRSTKERSR